MSRKLLPIIALIVVIIALMACGEADNTGSAVAVATSGNAAAQPTQAPVKAAHFKVGQAVKVGDTWQVTVNSIKTSTGNDVLKPQKDGDVYLLIDVSMNNLSAKEQDASSLLQWHLKDSTGLQYNSGINPDGATAPDGKVEGGTPLRGILTYEVPATMKIFTLGFESDIISSGQTIWDIGV